MEIQNTFTEQQRGGSEKVGVGSPTRTDFERLYRPTASCDGLTTHVKSPETSLENSALLPAPKTVSPTNKC